MKGTSRVLALGQTIAGDDGFGPRVLDALRRRIPPQIELTLARDTSDVVSALLSGGHTVIVDAVLGSPEGAVVVLDPVEVEEQSEGRVSSHGLSLTGALTLARELGAPGKATIVAAKIQRPTRYQKELSPLVEAAVETAVQQILALLGNTPCTNPTSPELS